MVTEAQTWPDQTSNSSNMVLPREQESPRIVSESLTEAQILALELLIEAETWSDQTSNSSNMVLPIEQVSESIVCPKESLDVQVARRIIWKEPIGEVNMYQAPISEEPANNGRKYPMTNSDEMQLDDSFLEWRIHQLYKEPVWLVIDMGYF